MRAKMQEFRIRGRERLGEGGIILRGVDMREVVSMIDPPELIRIGASFKTVEHNILDIDTVFAYPRQVDIDNYGHNK